MTLKEDTIQNSEIRLMTSISILKINQPPRPTLSNKSLLDEKD